MNLNDQLGKMYADYAASAPQEVLDIFKRASEKLVEDKLEEKALKVGDKLPSFELKNALGKVVKSSDLLAKGPLVISFYRGAWCPYCNLELRGYQEILGEIHSKGVEFVAISPELPDDSLSLTEKLELEFEVLNDFNNEIAKKLGIVFSLTDELKDLYEHFGIDLPKTQGNENFEMPVPGTYVVDSDGTIILAHVDIEYTRRLEPKEVLEVL